MSLHPLLPLIYHESQQKGSMLCAQHALNSLLQGNYFTPPDLSTIAQGLDHLEASYNHHDPAAESMNMDDTGFFSVQVLENALSVWGLRIPRWRSEEMRPYQDHPYTQLAFILNYQQHWYTLRRFGPAATSPDRDPGTGHWFNLDSSLDGPKWVSKLYLGMVIQQAEADGYSVFAVVQADPSAPLALPRTEADTIAGTLPEPTSSSWQNDISSSTSSSSQRHPPNPKEDLIEGLEDEDLELQAALQASITGVDPSPSQYHFASPTGFSSISESIPPPIMPGTFPPPLGMRNDNDDGPHSPPPPGESMAEAVERNRALLERMRAEQRFAQQAIQREYPADLAAPGGHNPWRRRGEEDEEDEMLRRAMRESEEMARAANESADVDIEDDDEDEDDDTDKETDDMPPLTRRSAAPPPSRGGTLPAGSASAHLDRVYDDDDAELQAALKASLEHVPEGFVLPELAPAAQSASTSRRIVHESELPLPRSSTRARTESTDTESKSETSLTTTSDRSPVAERQLSMDEIRKARLARFGG